LGIGVGRDGKKVLLENGVWFGSVPRCLVCEVEELGVRGMGV